MPAPQLEYPIRVASAAEFEEALKARIHVFVDIQKFSRELEPDEHDPTATHIVILCPRTDKVIGTLRILKAQGAAKIGRVVVMPEYQGLGLGKKMMAYAEQHIVANLDEYQGCEAIKLGSQMDKIRFYESCGYARKGEVFDDDGSPHVWMVKDVKSLMQSS
ncbi:hypothetical protein LPJ53_002185 [Coemansia erecta]|uniref:N-acetyltransferase domain-containing protein n=1 Tax=Coemansia erecta TaxID=147472 RepID=A0A9W8CU40_9FUNG|nr:hypothetical protein LPJ53_002185 [Coemansia erecta]